MIKQLDRKNPEIAHKIFQVFQNAYKIEARLIGALNFPPLQRSKADIQNSLNSFYGFYEKGDLAGVIEISITDDQLSIDSLTVNPIYFRKGIASKLIDFVLALASFSSAVVETAVANTPAIKLYQKHGFNEFKRWTPDHGIKKIALLLST